MSTTEGWSAAQAAGDPNPIERLGTSILDQVLGKSNARMVYGEPVQRGDRTIIPVARISARFGFGGGSGRTNTGKGPESGGGGGGGGSVDAKPIGYIEITEHGSEFQSIEDNTQIALAALRIGMVVALVFLLKFLFWRRGRNKQKQRAARLALPVVETRRRGPLRRKTVVEIVPDAPVKEAHARRWGRKAA